MSAPWIVGAIYVAGIAAVTFWEGYQGEDGEDIVGIAIFWPVIALVLVLFAPFLLMHKLGRLVGGLK